MSTINSFEELDIWKEASEIALNVYSITSIGDLKRDHGLKDQLQRAVVSISNNIAEGFEYDNNKDFIKYLRYAKGSA
ncbi:MAG: four helix bundle protein [Ignavibacteriae bacterium]|nr:MAG: four helix bundle protein [Ignavibacteriota bacterium]